MERKPSPWIQVSISAALILVSVISTYYIGISKQDEKRARLETRIAVLETQQTSLIKSMGELTTELKKSNENNQKLLIILASKFGLVIE